MDKIQRESDEVETVVSAQEKGKGVAPAHQSKASSQGRVKSSLDDQPENPGLKRKQTGDQSSQKYSGNPSTKRARPSSSSGSNATTAWNKREARIVSGTGEDDKVDMSSIPNEHKKVYNPSNTRLGTSHVASHSPAQGHGSPPASATHHVSRPGILRTVPDDGANRDLENQGSVARNQPSDDPTASPQFEHVFITVDAAALPCRVSRSAMNNHRPNTNIDAPTLLPDGSVMSRPGCPLPSSLYDPNNSIQRENYYFYHYFDPKNPYAHLAHNHNQHQQHQQNHHQQNHNQQQQHQQQNETHPPPPPHPTPPQPGTLAHTYSAAKIFYLIHRARLQQNTACPRWWRLPAAERQAQRDSAERMRARALYFWFRLHADCRFWWDGRCRGSGWEAGYDLGGLEFLRGLEDV